jgi:hypothetical protein
VLWWHSHRWVDWWWRSWSIWGSGWSRVVLAAAPRQTDTRISNRIPLHLVDGHFSGMSLDELDKTASLSWWDLDIGDLAKALEERAELVLSDIAGQSSNENCGVIWIGELVHWLRSTVVTNWWSTHGVHADWSWHTGWSWPSLVLWGGSGDAHWAVSAVDTLHLSQGTLLIHLIRESDETVTARKAVDWVGHDLGRLARWEARLEEGNQDVFINLWSQVSDENGELWSTIILAVSDSSSGSPVQLEWTVAVRNDGSVQGKSLSGGTGGREVDEAIASSARKLVSNHLHIDLLAKVEPDVSEEVLIHPWLELTHPDGGLSLAIGASSVLRSRLRVGSVWDWRGAWLLSTWLSLRRGSAGVWWGSSGRCSAGLLLVEIVVVRHLENFFLEEAKSC